VTPVFRSRVIGAAAGLPAWTLAVQGSRVLLPEILFRAALDSEDHPECAKRPSPRIVCR